MVDMHRLVIHDDSGEFCVGAFFELTVPTYAYTLTGPHYKRPISPPVASSKIPDGAFVEVECDYEAIHE